MILARDVATALWHTGFIILKYPFLVKVAKNLSNSWAIICGLIYLTEVFGNPWLKQYVRKNPELLS